MLLLDIPKSKATVVDSPVIAPERGIGKEGIVLSVEKSTFSAFKE